MDAPSSASRLDAFAREYLAPFGHHAEIRSEHLAESVRSTFGLSAFPSLSELLWLCDELGVERGTLPAGLGEIRGANVRYGAGSPQILLAADLPTAQLETTIVHELREVLENAFRLVDPTYAGLDTYDNRGMNPRSDRFGGYLLMATDASRDLMAAIGYDLHEFSQRVGRSLPSVLLRARYLYSSSANVGAPLMGAWLFATEWAAVKAGTATVDQMRSGQRAALSGFSQAKGTQEAAVFPTAGSYASTFSITADAVRDGRSHVRRLTGFDLFGERDYLVVAEPVQRFGVPWRVLLSAVRWEDRGLVKRWLERLDTTLDPGEYQFL